MTPTEYEKWQADQARELFSAPAEPPTKKTKTIRYRDQVKAFLGKGGKPRDAIVTIDKHQTMRIRPIRGRSKQAYELTMEQAVAWLMQKLRVPEKIGKPRRRRL